MITRQMKENLGVSSSHLLDSSSMYNFAKAVGVSQCPSLLATVIIELASTAPGVWPLLQLRFFSLLAIAPLHWC